MDVVSNLRDSVPRLDMQCFVPALERAPAFTSVPIESVGPRTLQVLHPGAQIRLRRLDRQMKMIAHDHIRVDPPAEALGRLFQGAFESLGRAVRSKDRPAVIAAIDHVVTSPLIFQSQRPGHNAEASVCSLVSRVRT